MESIVGKILCDRYRIVRELSQDDFSAVFDAEDLEQPHQQRCQIEKLQPSYDSEVVGAKSWQKVLQTYFHQGSILKNISQHPQIPQLLDFFECDRTFYLVRESINGQSLAQKLEQSLIGETEAISWLQEMLGVLDFIHQANLTHLNIQPSNLIEQYDGKKFLTNFSNVRNSLLLNSKTIKTISNNSFVAPEQRVGKHDFNTDIFALGKTIIYALTGKLDNFIKPHFSTANSSPDNAPVANIKVKLANILNKMVDENYAKRYQSAAEVLDELDFNQGVVTLPPPVFNNFEQTINEVYNLQQSHANSANSGRVNNKQKFIWLLLAIPFLIAVAIIFVGINKNAYRGFDNYSNNNYQFQLKYPQSWALRDSEDPITGEIVVFTSPLETDSDSFLERVYITVEYLAPEATTLEQYTQTVFERIKQAKGSEIEIYRDRKTIIDGSPARIIVYSRQAGDLQLRQMEAFTIKGDRAYVAIYTAERSKFSKFLPTARKMINSWELE